MILGFSKHSSKRHHMGLMTLVALLLWSGFALSGAFEISSATEWPVTEEGVKEHAKKVFGLVADIRAADINGDGELTYVEKDAFLVALAMMESRSFMETFPYADRNQSGRLDYLEVYGVIRGITLIAYADRRLTALQGGDQLDLEFCHTALYAQEWLLDQMIKAPEASMLDNIWSVIKRVQGPPTAYHHRMLDHGGPVLNAGKKGRRCDTGLNRFHELEGNINALRIQLNQEKDPVKAAKLVAMLNELESLLARLENS